MTPAEIAELRRLMAEATPGPWAYDTEDIGDEYVVMAPDILYGKDRAIIVDRDGALCPDVPGPLSTRFANADLICRAVNALPSLLDEIERLRGVVAALEADRTAVENAVAVKLDLMDAPDGETIWSRLGKVHQEVATLREIADAAREYRRLTIYCLNAASADLTCADEDERDAAEAALDAALRKGGR
jgi:hypothetical protein